MHWRIFVRNLNKRNLLFRLFLNSGYLERKQIGFVGTSKMLFKQLYKSCYLYLRKWLFSLWFCVSCLFPVLIFIATQVCQAQQDEVALDSWNNIEMRPISFSPSLWNMPLCERPHASLAEWWHFNVNSYRAVSLSGPNLTAHLLP